jgi:CHAD domain-containing protein
MASLTLEATLPPGDAAALFRQPAFAQRRAGRTRSLVADFAWLDTPKHALAAQGLALEAPAAIRAPRRLIRAMPAEGAIWRPGSPAETLPIEALPEAAEVPLAAFAGRRVTLPLTDAVEATLLHGSIRALSQDRPAARLLLAGPADAVLETMRALALDLPLLPSRCSLAEEARAFALAEPIRPRRLGAPRLDPELGVEAALRLLVGHLTEVLVWFAPVAAAGTDPAGVHQMRVALRRLRSALKAFRIAADGPALRRFDAEAKALAASLGPARDWDVFLAGLGAELAEAMPEEPRIAALLAAGRRNRDAAYAALRTHLAGPAFRRLAWDAVALDVQAPWRADAAEEAAARRDAPLPDLAGHLLAKRWRRLTAVGEDIGHLPDAEFHALRLDGKRMRYLAELFAPLYGRKKSRRFLDRLAEVQEQFGLANDATVARALVGPEANGPGAWAAGVAEGWVRARSRRARSRAAKAWAELLAADPFWNQG